MKHKETIAFIERHHDALTKMGFKSNTKEALNQTRGDNVVYHHPDTEKFKEVAGYFKQQGYVSEKADYRHRTGKHRNMSPTGSFKFTEHTVQIGTEKSLHPAMGGCGTFVNFLPPVEGL